MTTNVIRKTVVIGLCSMLVLAACGDGTEEAADVATLQSADAQVGSAADAAVVDDGDDDATATDQAPDEVALEFSQCMRDQGLDFPDLTVNAEGNIEMRAAMQTIDPGADGFREAMGECDEILQQTGFGGGRRAAFDEPEFQDALIEFSACLRDEGFDVGDLTLDAPGGQPPEGAPAANGDGDGGAAGGAEAGQQGERPQGFGNRGARFAENLGLDYEDLAVEAAVDECIVVVDEALADLGVGQPADQG